MIIRVRSESHLSSKHGAAAILGSPKSTHKNIFLNYLIVTIMTKLESTTEIIVIYVSNVYNVERIF